MHGSVGNFLFVVRKRVEHFFSYILRRFISIVLRPHHIIEVNLGPSNELVDGGDERLADVSETIFYARGHLGIYLTIYEVTLVKFLESLGEHLL